MSNRITASCTPLLLTSPDALRRQYPVEHKIGHNIDSARERIRRITAGEDPRLLVIVGPCSIHDAKAAYDYATRLASLRHQYQDRLEIVMRCYFRKPRTTIGWTGLINDPYLDASGAINDGLAIARDLLLQIAHLELPAATEFLEPLTAGYISDLISWGAIGARTTESQIHREMASSLPCPIGFKNGTDGNIRIAIDAICAASHPHYYCAPSDSGQLMRMCSQGNPDGHLILRGGRQPNYHREDIDTAITTLARAGHPPRVIVDFSHGNSQKQFSKQLLVGDAIASQLREGNQGILGVMIESFIQEGHQLLRQGNSLVYGQSVTDGCLGWEDTHRLLEKLALASHERFKHRSE